MIDLELNKPIRVTVDFVDTLTKWVMASTVVTTIFFTILLVIQTQNKDPASKFVRFRDRVALLFSADVFYKVIQDSEQSHSSDQELLTNNTGSTLMVINEEPSHQKHSCYTQDILISTIFGKNTFYCLFILSLPLHAVMICLIILLKIFVNEINLESCASYMLSTRDDAYYYCQLASKSLLPETIVRENITGYCDSTAINGTYNNKIDDIVCLQYYFDKTKIIEIVTNIFVWQKLSATVSVSFIRYFQYLFRHSFSCRQKSICLSCFLPLLIILFHVAIIVVLLGLYLFLGSQSLRSILTIDLIGAAAATLIYVVICMNVYTWIARDENKYQPCLFQVGVTTYQ